MATNEQLELRRKWVEALRSEKYEQTTGLLKDEKGFCCLGVLCDIVGEKFEKLTETNREKKVYDHDVEAGAYGIPTDLGYEKSSLPAHVMQLIGLQDTTGSFEYFNETVYNLDVADGLAFEDDKEDYIEFTSLADKNDNGMTFKEIADLIESKADVLFND